MLGFEPAQLTRFVHELQWEDLPRDVREALGRSALDLLAALAAGSATPLGAAVRAFVAAEFEGHQAVVAFSDLRSTVAGAALANGMSIDAMDSHDGHRLAKGHAGAGVFSAALACGEAHGWSGTQFMTALAVGYEVALRAAIALHATAADYHSSGAWVSLGAAAVSARAAGLSPAATRHALGIAEYHGPRSPMMRCIDHPTMLKDGAGWGSLTGVTAAGLAQAGFSGAPAVLVEGEASAPLWLDVGRRWRIREVYLKPYACCRWAQPAIHAALGLQREHGVEPEEVERLTVHTFSEAARLSVARPENTEQAQYSLPYAVAAAMVAGQFGPREVQEPFIRRPEVLGLAGRVAVVTDSEIDSAFPERALARVVLAHRDGRRLTWPTTAAPGGPDQPLSDEAVREKFLRYAAPIVGDERAGAILRAVGRLPRSEDLSALLGALSGAA